LNNAFEAVNAPTASTSARHWGLEGQTRKTRAMLREDVPKIEKQLTVLERTGVTPLECEGTVWAQASTSSRARLSAATEEPECSYRGVPEAVHRDVESGIRRE
jgi:hypothetical protein